MTGEKMEKNDENTNHLVKKKKRKKRRRGGDVAPGRLFILNRGISQNIFPHRTLSTSN